MQPDVEHVDVLVVGAGLSGVAAGHYVKTDCPWASFAIFEGRASMGGTWDLFKYPGIRSDSDMHTLGFAFRPWDGKKSIADGADILQYIKDTAAEEGLGEHLRFNHKVLSADWSSAEARWRVTAERTDTGEQFELTCGFLFSCAGYYRYDRGYLPDFEGTEDFSGQIIHPQHWPEDLDYTDKRVVVIGSGATAVTLIPSMADDAEHVVMLQRSPSYIVTVPATQPIARLLRRVLPKRVAGTVMRWVMAIGTQSTYFISKRRPQLVRRYIRRMQARQLPKDFDIDTHFNPTYDPWDQRLCAVPGGDLFKAISAGKASVVTDRIVRFTEKGLLLESGEELLADIIITATGLQVQLLGGTEVTLDGAPLDVSDRLVYKGMMLEGVPNAAMAVGYSNASWTLKTELTCDYVARLLNHMRSAPRHRVHADERRGRDGGGVRVRPQLRLPQPRRGSAPQAGLQVPVAGPPELPQRLPRDEARRDRRRDLGVLEPGSRRGREHLVKSFEGRVAAVTGAGSGIGRALAVDLARRGAHLALSDIDEVGLAETVTQCEGAGVKVTSQRVDVADREAMFAWADQVVADHGKVNLIFNNAGVALGATIEAMSYDDFEWLMNINFWGVVHGTKAFLPHLKAAGEGHIVNLSSVFGLISIPSQSAYNAAKFGVRGFTDALRMELDIAKCGVSCTTVHPGGIKTNIARNARMDDSVSALAGSADPAVEFDKIAMTSPEKAARQILAAVRDNQRRALIGPDAKAIDLVARLPAGIYQRVLVFGARHRR